MFLTLLPSPFDCFAQPTLIFAQPFFYYAFDLGPAYFFQVVEAAF